MIWHAYRREWTWIKYAAISWNEVWNLKTSFEIQYSWGSKVDTHISIELIGFLSLHLWRSSAGHDMWTAKVTLIPIYPVLEFLNHELVHNFMSPCKVVVDWTLFKCLKCAIPIVTIYDMIIRSSRSERNFHLPFCGNFQCFQVIF